MTAPRVDAGSGAAALSRALHDGVVDLPDGSRLEAAEGFRVVAVAEPNHQVDAELRRGAQRERLAHGLAVPVRDGDDDL